MDEAGFWSSSLRPQLVRQCQALKLRHHFERVENGVADGTPDVDYCIAGVEGGIELKFAPTHPVRETSMVLTKGKGLRRSQIVYAARRSWSGGRVWCCIGTPEAVWLIDLRPLAPPDMEALERATPVELAARAVWFSGRDQWSRFPVLLAGS